MDKTDILLNQFSLIPDSSNRINIIELLELEIQNNDREDNEYLKLLCILLYTFGVVEDTQFIWKAKNIDFDTGCYIDGDLLIGAGMNETIRFLESTKSTEAAAEKDYLIKMKDYKSREELINFYTSYYGIH